MKKLLTSILILCIMALPTTSFAWPWGGSGSGGTAAITGGTIDGAVIGGTTPAAGSFTSLTDTGLTASLPVVTDANKVLASMSFANFLTALGAAPAFVSGTANYFWATPNGSAGVPSLRAIVAADIPTLNQSTSGTAANLSGTPALPNGTTATTQSQMDNSTKLATTAYADGKQPGGKNAQTVTANAVTCDWSLGATCTVTTQNAVTAWTLTMSNPVDGRVYRIKVKQAGATLAPIPTFSPTVNWPASTAPTAFTNTSGHSDIITCLYEATYYDCDIRFDFAN